MSASASSFSFQSALQYNTNRHVLPFRLTVYYGINRYVSRRQLPFYFHASRKAIYSKRKWEFHSCPSCDSCISPNGATVIISSQIANWSILVVLLEWQFDLGGQGRSVPETNSCYTCGLLCSRFKVRK